MNIDLLTKLVRLANNNPNENEANLAARKVCKLIEEGKFNFNGHVKTAADKVGGTWNDVTRSKEAQWSSKPPEGPPTEAQKKAYEDLLNFIKMGFEQDNPFYQQFYGGARGGGKSYESEPIYVEYVDFDPITREYILSTGERISEIKAYNDPNFRKKYKVRPTEQTRPANPFSNKDDRGFYPGWGQKVKEPKPKRILKCCICGKDNETAFVGHPAVYRCLTCNWEVYEKEKKEKVK